MRIGRLEIGLVKRADKKINFWPFDLYQKGMCGCHLFECFCFFATWLGPECYGTALERRGRALKRLANIRHIKNGD